MTQKDVAPVLQQHQRWVQNQNAGKRADFRGSVLKNVVLIGSDLRYADFRAADLTGANLSQCDCRGADFRGANMTNATLVATRLQHARLEGANLTGVDLREADLEQAQMKAVNVGMSYRQALADASKRAPGKEKPKP
jgi:uncharacterized protein YjbI with pentapeptide repeats